MFRALDIVEDWPHLRERLPVKLCEDTKGIVHVSDENVIDAVCVFDNWTFTAVQTHIWMANPFVIREGFLNQIAEYAFNQCGMQMLIGLVNSDNQKALGFDKHIGFKELLVIPDGFAPGVDQHILQLRREDCRWLNEEEGQASG
jgi:RimJ/RimL family protein N-acetyltransferase